MYVSENVDDVELTDGIIDLTPLGVDRVSRLTKMYSSVTQFKELVGALIEDINEPERRKHETAKATWVEATKLHESSSSSNGKRKIVSAESNKRYLSIFQSDRYRSLILSWVFVYSDRYRSLTLSCVFVYSDRYRSLDRL